MILRVDGTVYRGRAVSPDVAVAPSTVARAVREGEVSTGGTTVSVVCRQPPPVHDRVGCLHQETGLRVRTALAEAGRARGLSTRHDDALRTAREQLRDRSVASVELADKRRAVAESSAETARLRERVAETRGRLAARRDLDAETDDLATELERAAQQLSEAETSAVAARQDLDRRRREARTVRDRLDRRMALEDEVANLRRRARAALVDRLGDAYVSAVADVPGGPAEIPEDPFSVDPVTAGLAVARIADFDAPVVIACDRFSDADAASTWLAAPVVKVR